MGHREEDRSSLPEITPEHITEHSPDKVGGSAYEDTAPVSDDYIRAFDAVGSDENGPSGMSAGKKAALAASLLAAAALLISICYYNLPGNRYKRIMKAASEYLNDHETVLAAECYRNALKLIPGSEDAEEALYGIWSKALDDIMGLADGGKFSEALVYARLLPEIDPDRYVMNRSAITVIYKQWVCRLAESNDTEGINKLLLDAAVDLTAEEIEQVRQEADRAENYYILTDRLNEKAERIISLNREGSINEVFAEIPMLVEMADQYMDLGGSAPFVFGWEDGKEKLGYFFSGNDVSVVIGRIGHTGIAEGRASAYYVESLGTEDQYLYWYVCDWKSGKPDGYCEYMESGGDMTDPGERIAMKGMLSDGDWNGDVEETYTDGETYTIKFVSGHAEVLAKEDADKNVVGYNKDGSRKRYYSDQAVNHEYGVPFMYYN